MRAMSEVFRLVLRQQLTRGRFLLWGGLLALTALLAVAARTADDVSADERIDVAVFFAEALGLQLVIPVIALVLGAAALGDLQDDETMVYLWLRPVARWTIVAGAVLAVAAVAVPASIVPFVVAGLVLTPDGGAIGAIALSTGLGALAYGAVFTVVGLVVRRALIWGLVYVFIWEFFVATAAEGARRVSINAYPASVLTGLVDVAESEPLVPVAAGIVVPLMVAGVAVAIGGWLLNRLDIA